MLCLGEVRLVRDSIKAAPFKSIKLLYQIIFEEEGNRGSRRKIGMFSGFELSSDELSNKKAYIDQNLTFVEIVSVCNVLMLECEGNKQELIVTVLNALTDLKSLQPKENPDESEDYETEDDESLSEDVNDKIQLNENLNDACFQVIKHENRTNRISKEDEPAFDTPKFLINFRDVEDSLRTFDGSDDYPIERWVEEFQDMSDLMCWNNIQQLIFAKKLLKGLAKTFMQATPGMTSWSKLKSKLLDEFSTKIRSAHLHNLLSNKRMKKEDSIQQYFLEMRELASRGKIEDEALIYYIINGITDDDKYKIILYGAKDLDEFKKKLKDDEQMKKMMKKTPVRDDIKSGTKKIINKELMNEKVRCYSCGGLGHKHEDCLHKGKGARCFKCNKFGHKSFECNTSQRPKENTTALILPDDTTKFHNKWVSIFNTKISALIDTGSSVNIIREDIYHKIGAPELQFSSRKLVGFGGQSVKLRGCFYANVHVDTEIFFTKIYVTPLNSTQIEMVIGQELLQSAELISSVQGIRINKLPNNTTDPMMNIMIDDESNKIEIGDGVTKLAKEEIKNLVENYNPCKTKQAGVNLRILVTSENPISAPPRRLPFADRDFVQQQVEDWLKEGIIEPCCSDFASQVVVTKKKNGDKRLCIDYRRLNKVIVKDRYPLPLIDDVIDRLQKAKILSTLDLRNGFFHVPVEEDSKKYTAFVTHNGHYRFRWVPFGLCNSPSTFQRYVNEVFKDLINTGLVLPYLDDFVIPAENEKDAIDKLKHVFAVASEYGLDFNFRKCRFLHERIHFLGHVIENGKIRPSTEKIKAVLDYPEPKNIKQVQSFLGLSGYFRKFVQGYSVIAKPLTLMLKKDAKFSFTNLERNSFQNLKRVLSESPVLQIYRQGAYTELHTDASADGYGFVLLQRSNDDGKLHPIYYGSRTTTPAEKKYRSYELEVLAVVEALKKFRIYLLGQKFKIITDCDAFRKTLDKKDLAARVARWVMLLEEYDYEIEHRSGTQMRHVDALSRFPVMQVVDTLLLNIRRAQDDDLSIKAIKEVLKEKPYDDYYL